MGISGENALGEEVALLYERLKVAVTFQNCCGELIAELDYKVFQTYLKLAESMDVRAASGSIPPPWRPSRFRLTPRACDATPLWALSTCSEPNETKKNAHPTRFTAVLHGG